MAIAEAPDLEWGMKQSWRRYVGAPSETSGGASVIPSTPHQIAWRFEGGSYDPADGTTVLRYAGTVRWTAHDGILDVTLSNPVITISSAESTISLAEALTRSITTGEIEHFDDVRIADLDVGAVSPVVAGGITTWSGIPSASAPDAQAVFAGYYRQGTAFDAVSFSYMGPGGAPDFSEHWDEPGSSPLRLDANEMLTDNGLQLQFEPYLLDREGRLIYFRWNNDPSAATGNLYQAFSLDRMEALGQPLETISGTPQNPANPMFYDSNTGCLFYEASGGEVRWMKYDREDERWLQESVPQPFPRVGGLPMMWDSVGEVAFNFTLNKPDGVASNDFDHQQWQLNTYKEQPDGSWVRQTYDVPNGPLGLNRDRYPLTSPLKEPKGLAAPDGSLIVLGTRQRSNNSSVPAPAKVPGAYRIKLDAAAGTADVEAIAGTEVTNSLAGVYEQIQSGKDDQVVLTRQESGTTTPTLVQTVAIPGDGSPAVAEPAVTLSGLETGGPLSFAVDREDGTIWIGGNQSQRLTGLRGGRIIDSQFFTERHPRGGPVMVGEHHAVYAQTNDGSPAGFGGSPIYGMGRFERLGIAPEVNLDPHSTAASLGVGEESRQVTFSSTATGELPPTRQWQQKLPGSSRFTNIPGQTGETLSVTAEAGMDGAEYRAVYENAAGKVASEAAKLGVDYAPRVRLDPASVTTTEGQSARFSVLAVGNPEPTIVWQRRVGGFWQNIASDDDNFTGADGPNLTVLETNADQSGALFRAKLINEIGTMFSGSARLTVTPRVSIPPAGLDLDDVSLEWTGNEEMQKAPPRGGSNYFSAGFSDGNEATYRSLDGNAAIYQVSPSGSESLATYSARAAHVSNGGEQLVRLYGGDARIEPDGSATVDWEGSFSVNFYGGLVPFTFTDPELSVNADGFGVLTAKMTGCASSIEDPSVCTPFASAPDVTVATFADAQVDPSGKVEIRPDYAGVEVDDVDPKTPQVRTGSGWGSWPASFVAFHVQTGLAAYWYTSGSSFDPDKAPLPFVVDFQGASAPSTPPQKRGSSRALAEQDQPPRGSTPAKKPISIAVTKRRQKLGGRHVAPLATLSCPSGVACNLSAPRRVRAKIGKRRYPFVVMAPKRIGPGKKAAVRLRLPKGALRALGRHKRATAVKLRVRSAGKAYEIRVMLRGVGRGKVKILHVGVRRIGRGRGSKSPQDPAAGPISGEPPLLQRPPTAVDVSGVRLTWYPRDSWLRYAASGVAAGDGIHIGGGAAGSDSTSSPCPDQRSSSDAQLPYAIDFAPRASWYDPASGIVGIYGQGSVNFRWRAHTIDLTASEPEIEINGSASRAIFRFSGSEGTPYPNQRADLLNLDTAGRPTVSNGGKTLTYDLMRGTLTANGVNVFAGFYTPPDNDEFGCVSVSFTIP
ncbi:MAG TPA: HtaA domain-containing protein [Solirubrobacterales bacterium]|nr:HtaA domain-containing protein [Solirubrobacterales bacterium]